MDDIIEVAEAEPEADASAVDISPTPPAQGPIDTATDKFEIEEVEAQLPAMTSGPTAALSTGFSPRHRRDTIVSRPLPAPAQRSDAWPHRSEHRTFPSRRTLLLSDRDAHLLVQRLRRQAGTKDDDDGRANDIEVLLGKEAGRSSIPRGASAAPSLPLDKSPAGLVVSASR